MSDGSSSDWGHVVLLAIALLLPVGMWLKNERSLAYCPTSDGNMIVAVIAVAAGLAAIYAPILVYRRRRCRASGDVHDSVREMKRRAARQTVRKTEPARAIGRLDLENGLVWLETNATVPVIIFAAMHCTVDGNGRLARLVANPPIFSPRSGPPGLP